MATKTKRTTAERIAYYNPPRPRPRTLVEDLAVAELDKTECKRGTIHLIPATATICIKCGADALNPKDSR